MIHKEVEGRAIPKAVTGGAPDTFTGLSYGDDIPCPNCGNAHPIFETQVVYEVCKSIVRLMTAQGTTQAMMLGVLRGNGQYFAACSPADGTAGQTAFSTALQTGRHSLPPIVLVGNLPAPGTTSRGGSRVSANDIRQCTVQNQPIAGRCAAPKLIHVATTQGIAHPWHMSEVWFDPQLGSDRYDHFNTAESCETCKRLLPRLLCKRGDEVDLRTFTGLIRAQWGGF